MQHDRERDEWEARRLAAKVRYDAAMHEANVSGVGSRRFDVAMDTVRDARATLDRIDRNRPTG